MRNTQILLNEKKLSGNVVLNKGFYRIKWKYEDGRKDNVTPYGFRREEQAQSHIELILSEQQKVYVLR